MQLTKDAEHRRKGGKPVELVVDGRTLTHILGDAESESALAELGARASAVVVCRASPSQKAAIVALMREWELRQMTGGRRSAAGRWIAKRKRKMQARDCAFALRLC